MLAFVRTCLGYVLDEFWTEFYVPSLTHISIAPLTNNADPDQIYSAAYACVCKAVWMNIWA